MMLLLNIIKHLRKPSWILYYDITCETQKSLYAGMSIGFGIVNKKT